MKNSYPITLVLGLGNILMGDEGVGVHAVRQIEAQDLPEGIECLDGGTGGFTLLEPLERAEKIFIIDAASDGNPVGTLTRTEPRFAADFPPSLTAHDIGIKDLLDLYYMLGSPCEVVLYAITIDPQQPICMNLSAPVQEACNLAAIRILGELSAALAVQ